MEEILRKEIWKIAERHYSPEESHGLPHIRGVHNNFNAWLGGFPALEDIAAPIEKLPPMVFRIADSLEAAAILHDIGHGNKNGTPHAVESAKMAEKMAELDKIFSPEEKEWLVFAIENHSRGLKGKLEYGAGKEKEFCLALLVVFDHMEGIGATGIYRTIKDSSGRIPLYPEKTSVRKQIFRYLEYPDEIVNVAKSKMVESSIIEHLTYNYCATFDIEGKFNGDRRTKEILPANLRKEIRRRREEMKSFILSLLKNQHFERLRCNRSFFIKYFELRKWEIKLLKFDKNYENIYNFLLKTLNYEIKP